jgi:hypothetical protein
MNRLWELDALRGLMLVLMTLTHLPTRFSDPAGQPFGWVSAAEGFVFLSAFMVGRIYSDIALKKGVGAMWRAFEARALTIYACQVALLALLFTVIAAIGITGDQPAIKGLVSFFIDAPGLALPASLLLLYNPPLLDILPMYVLFMLVSPWVMLHGLRRGWLGLMAASTLLWLGAQFGLESAAYRWVVDATGLKVPFSQTGAFDMVAWQFLWMIGLALGAGGMAAGHEPEGRPLFPRWWVAAAVAVAVTCLAWRHWRGQAPFEHWQHLNVWFDKWELGPLRLINFFAIVTLALHYGPRISPRLPRLQWLETMGSASLPVFCAHLVVVLLALAVFGPPTPERPLWLDVALLAGTFAVLYTVAEVSRASSAGAAKIAARRDKARGAVAVSEAAR